ncbi:hypothetical protein [Caldicoprobacter faecalis]|uniref:Uncharacterized protein n=1 Tax=Caldicoprobacter faecalis TaxID=937334 RepID=A0A1I5T1Y1_9FIRM|nr:hypothetical protein [Caldicoprobacter faecalis]SFP77045.1 hypothetical protein SAMN05444406_103145 [Caldicoprobacter faecalis]
MPKSKEQLLLCAESAADYINQTGGGGFVSFILDMIDFVSETEQHDIEKVQNLYEILYNVKSSNMEVIGGGNRLKRAYVDFIENFLKLSKVSAYPNKYNVDNEEFRDLSLNELHYVFGWVRRLIKAQGSSRLDEEDRRRHEKKQARNMEDSSCNNRYGNPRNYASNYVDGALQRSGLNTSQRGGAAKRHSLGDTSKGSSQNADKGIFNTQMQEQLAKLVHKNKKS